MEMERGERKGDIEGDGRQIGKQIGRDRGWRWRYIVQWGGDKEANADRDDA
jgi:hypothetical protein